MPNKIPHSANVMHIDKTYGARLKKTNEYQKHEKVIHYFDVCYVFPSLAEESVGIVAKEVEKSSLR